MKVLVTGGGGFIGAATVAESRRRGWDAILFDRVSGDDILDRERVMDATVGVDAVIHLAGVLGTHELFDDPYLAVDVNVNGTLNILEGCRWRGCAYVGITMPQVFPSIYTATKTCGTRLASAYHHSHRVPVSHVRAFNAFGPGQAHGAGHPQKIVPTFAVEAWAGRPIPIWGDGTQTVDLIDVWQLARLLVDAVGHGDDVVFDGGSGVALTVNRVAEAVLELTTSTAGVQYLPMRRGEVPTRIVAEGEGWDRLDWRPSLDWDALAASVRAYRAHPLAQA
jgi:UDP-glucose 4-epimerase